MSSPFSPETNRRLNNMAQAVVLAPSSNNAVQMLDNSNPSASAALIASSARHQRSPQHSQLVAVAQDNSDDDDSSSNASASSVQSEPQIEVLNSDEEQQERDPDEQYEDQLIPNNTELANCQLCYSEFDPDPDTGRFAPCCGKSMCGTCIKRHKDTKEKDDHEFICPFCRNKTAFVSWGNRCVPTPQVQFNRLIAEGEQQNAQFHASVDDILNQIKIPIERKEVGALPKPNLKRVADRTDVTQKRQRALDAAESHINDANRYRREGIAALEKAIQYADKAAEANARFLLYDQCAALKQSY